MLLNFLRFIGIDPDVVESVRNKIYTGTVMIPTFIIFVAPNI